MSFHCFSIKSVKARKLHKCIWCGQRIEVGSTYRDERSVFDGNMQRHRWHPECDDEAADFFRKSGEETFDAHENERAIIRVK
jgi:hypothetical protein